MKKELFGLSRGEHCLLSKIKPVWYPIWEFQLSNIFPNCPELPCPYLQTIHCCVCPKRIQIKTGRDSAIGFYLEDKQGRQYSENTLLRISTGMDFRVILATGFYRQANRFGKDMAHFIRAESLFYEKDLLYNLPPSCALRIEADQKVYSVFSYFELLFEIAGVNDKKFRYFRLGNQTCGVKQIKYEDVEKAKNQPSFEEMKPEKKGV